MPFKFNPLTGKLDMVITGVDSDTNFVLDTDGNSYIKYNSTTNKVELWVDGTKKQQWG